jgi:hypothetical protein
MVITKYLAYVGRTLNRQERERIPLDPDIKRLIDNLKNDIDNTTSAVVSGGIVNENAEGAEITHESAASALRYSGGPPNEQGSFDDIPLLSSPISDN